MSMANLTDSEAILKEKYPSGTLPKSVYKNRKVVSSLPKSEDFNGELQVVAIQNEYGQGVSSRFQNASLAAVQSSYKKFQVYRVTKYAIARVTGEAMDAAKGEGALVDLWRNEMDSTGKQCLEDLEVDFMGNGSGVRGQVSSGSTVSSTTITLAKVSDVAKFKLNMTVQCVSTNTLSPTLLPGSAPITAIDRLNGTLTIAVAWNSVFTGITAGSTYIIRGGDYASSGTAAVSIGFPGYIVGGTTPGTLWGLDRNSDPVRLAGETYSGSGQTIENAIIEASALVAQQGGSQPNLLVMHPRDLADFKKALGTKVMYTRGSMSGSTAKGSGSGAEVSFSTIEIDGDDGTISIISSPFQTRNTAFLMYQDCWKLHSLGGAPQLDSRDGNTFLRMVDADAFEARWKYYGNFECNEPYSNVRITDLGGTS